MKTVFLSVVIPSYNETENLRRGVLSQVESYLATQKYSWEVIISDDGSSEEESKAIARDFCQRNTHFRFLENDHAGKPFAIWSGIKAASGRIILFTDMDQSTPLGEIGKLLPYFDKGFDIVIGSRGLERKNFPVIRQLASAIFRGFRRSVLLPKVVDTQAGFKAMRTNVAQELFPLLEIFRLPRQKTTGWKVTAFDVELLVAGQRRGYKIAEVPVFWADRDISTKKSRGMAKFVQESIEMFQEIFRVKFNDLRGFYNR